MTTKETAPEPTVWVNKSLLATSKDEPNYFSMSMSNTETAHHDAPLYAVPPSLTQGELRQVSDALEYALDHFTAPNSCATALQKSIAILQEHLK